MKKQAAKFFQLYHKALTSQDKFVIGYAISTISTYLKVFDELDFEDAEKAKADLENFHLDLVSHYKTIFQDDVSFL
ncbi:MAG: hypothetical protein WKG06_12720 [Segetibacter sp.]